MKTIPVTKLRNFYDSLCGLGLTAATQLSILKDINTSNKYKHLILLRHIINYDQISILIRYKAI